tara:strand:+ start:145 stop:492 length:348 start_codon:yes stop_codon:yes gene_type:complete
VGNVNTKKSLQGYGFFCLPALKPFSGKDFTPAPNFSTLFVQNLWKTLSNHSQTCASKGFKGSRLENMHPKTLLIFKDLFNVLRKAGKIMNSIIKTKSLDKKSGRFSGKKLAGPVI